MTGFNEPYKCRGCENTLDLRLAKDGVITCPYCGNVYTLPKEDASPQARHFLFMGEHELDVCKFSDAYAAFKKAAELNPKEPQAYWGMARAEFKVQYLRDAATKQLQPIVHEITEKKFTESKNYLKLFNLATTAQIGEYVKQGTNIDHIRDEFYKLKNSGLDYDCFICVKVTDDETKQRTADYKEADDLYFHLKGKGYKPFFSERELYDVRGADYEARILYALYSAECMLVVCSNENYLNTPWVKNEYTRFLKLVNDEEKESDAITIVFNGKPIERLQGKNGRIQGINLKARDAYEAIVSYVENHTPEGRKKRAEAARKQQQQEEEVMKQIAQQKEILRAYEEKLNNLSTSGASSDGISVSSLLTRAKQFIETSDWNSAKAYYDKALDRDPQCAEAWWGSLQLEFNAHSTEEILDRLDWKAAERIENSHNFHNAVRYADPKLKKAIDAFSAQLHSAERWWNKFLTEMGVKNERQILEQLDKRMMQRTEESKNYYNADKYSDGDFKVRIKNFKNALYSAESYWKLFLQDFDVQSESAFYDTLNDSKLKLLESNVNYQKATTLATGEFHKQVSDFNNTIHSGELWWKLFLKEQSVETEQELLDRFVIQQYQSFEKDAYYQNAKQYASEKFMPRIQAFESQAADQYAAYKKAAACWARLLKECGCKSDSDLNSLNYFIIDQENYREALDWAKKSCVKAVIARFENVGEVQRKAVIHAEEQRKAASQAKRKAIIHKILSVMIFVVLYAALAITEFVLASHDEEWVEIPWLEYTRLQHFTLPQVIAFYTALGVGLLSQLVSAFRGKSYLTQVFVWVYQIPAFLFVCAAQYLYLEMAVTDTTLWAMSAFTILYMCVIFSSQCTRGAKMGRLKLCLPNLLAVAVYVTSLLYFASLAGIIELFPISEELAETSIPIEIAELFSSIEIALVCMTAVWIIFLYCAGMQHRILSFIFMPVCIYAIVGMAMPESGSIWMSVVVIVVTFVVLFVISKIITVIRRKFRDRWRT